MIEDKGQTEVNEQNVDRNTQLLRFFCVVLESIGWILIVWGTMWFMYLFSGPRATKMTDIREMHVAISGYSFDFVFMGLVAVILAHLARYIFERHFRLGLLLRCGDKILYLFAIFTVGWAVFRWFYYYVEAIQELRWRILLAQPIILPTVAKVLILVCLGQILKRIIPVIEESKTLV